MTPNRSSWHFFAISPGNGKQASPRALDCLRLAAFAFGSSSLSLHRSRSLLYSIFGTPRRSPTFPRLLTRPTSHQYPLTKKVSIIKMANAMLEEEFRSSHEDLMQIHNNALAPPPRLSNFQRQPPESPRKVEFVDLPPPKRSRVGSVVWSTKSVLQGRSDTEL